MSGLVQDQIIVSKLDNHALWVYLKEFDCCVCVPSKNGGSSFRVQLIRMRGYDILPTTLPVMNEFYRDGHGPFHPKEVEMLFSDKPQYLSVRHPVERFASLWRSKARDRNGSPYLAHGMTPDELMDHIETVNDSDWHWRPQIRYMTKNAQPVHPSGLLALFSDQERINTTSERDSDPRMPVDRIMDFYSEDYELWRRTNDPVSIQVS